MHTITRPFRTSSLAAMTLIASTAVAVASASAQTSTGSTRSPASPAKGSAESVQVGSPVRINDGDWMLSVNPLGLVVGGLTGEAERKLGGARTIAIAANYWGAYGANYLSMDAKLRFYRRDGATRVGTGDAKLADFEGLSFGPMIGFQRVGISLCDTVSETCSATGLTAGGGVDYGWRLGERKQFSVIAGGGLKTSFGFSALASARITYPFLRLAVGYVLPGQSR